MESTESKSKDQRRKSDSQMQARKKIEKRRASSSVECVVNNLTQNKKTDLLLPIDETNGLKDNGCQERRESDSSKAYFQGDGVRRGYDIEDTDAVDLLIVEKLAAFEKTEVEEEEEVMDFNEEEKEKLSKIVKTIRGGSTNFI